MLNKKSTKRKVEMKENQFNALEKIKNLLSEIQANLQKKSNNTGEKKIRAQRESAMKVEKLNGIE